MDALLYFLAASNFYIGNVRPKNNAYTAFPGDKGDSAGSSLKTVLDTKMGR